MEGPARLFFAGEDGGADGGGCGSGIEAENESKAILWTNILQNFNRHLQNYCYLMQNVIWNKEIVLQIACKMLRFSIK